MKILHRPLQIIRADLRVYVIANVFVYGLILVGMGVGALFPEITASRIAAATDGGALSEISSLLDNVWLLALAIVANNVIIATILVIVVPSLIIPFLGIALFALSLIDTGLLLAPVDASSALVLIPHSLTLLIEMQAYALVLFGVFLLGRAWIRPASVGAKTRRRGYVVGLQRLGWLAIPALALHIIGAIYEAFETAYLIPAVLGA